MRNDALFQGDDHGAVECHIEGKKIAEVNIRWIINKYFFGRSYNHNNWQEKIFPKKCFRTNISIILLKFHGIQQICRILLCISVEFRPLFLWNSAFLVNYVPNKIYLWLLRMYDIYNYISSPSASSNLKVFKNFFQIKQICNKKNDSQLLFLTLNQPWYSEIDWTVNDI